MSEGHTSAVRILREVPVEGLEVRELHGPDAVDSILSDFTDLELVPIEEDAERAKMRRAGFVVDQPSARQALRDELKGGDA